MKMDFQRNFHVDEVITESVTIVTGAPGCGTTSKLRVLANLVACELPTDQRLVFLDLNVFGMRVAGEFYVQMYELARVLALCYERGFRHFLVAGTCANFSSVCKLLAGVSNRTIAFMNVSHERLRDVILARGYDDSSMQYVDTFEAPRLESTPPTPLAMKAWQLQLHEIARTRANDFDYDFFDFDMELPMKLEPGGFGRPVIQESFGSVNQRSGEIYLGYVDAYNVATASRPHVSMLHSCDNPFISETYNF